VRPGSSARASISLDGVDGGEDEGGHLVGVGEDHDVAALAVHLMANTAVTGATFDIDGGQQLTGS
jgi:hypothetical protein